MSFVIAAPEMMAAAATDLAGIGSALSEAQTAAMAATVGLVPAAADEVSAGVAHLFSRYAEDFHGLAGRAAAFHEQFVGRLSAGAGSYAGAEAAAAAQVAPWQQSLFNVASKLAPLLGRSPVTTPVAGDPDLISQTGGGLLRLPVLSSRTSLSDPDDNYFDSISVTIFGGLRQWTLTWGFEPTLGLGAPGQTLATLTFPLSQTLGDFLPPAPPRVYTLPPVPGPLARLFWALLPLGF
jgi:hypothetical protein